MLSITSYLIIGVAVLSALSVFAYRILKKDIHGKRGNKALKGRDRNAVLKAANRRIAQNPKDAEALTSLLDLHFNEEDYEKSMQYSKILIDFFSRFENVTLELKTKSINVENILKLNHKKRTVIAWSLNPQSVIDSDEWQTSSLEERLSAARRCCQAGYSVGFHFDPVIYSANWEREYREVVDALFKKINSANIAWISLGTFRFSPRLKTIIEQRFPQSKILDEELMLGFDRKLRYRSKQRIRIYKKMVSWIRSHCRFTLVYLCMEPKEIWREVLGRSRF